MDSGYTLELLLTEFFDGLNMWFKRKERCQGSFQGFWCEQLKKKQKKTKQKKTTMELL